MKPFQRAEAGFVNRPRFLGIILILSLAAAPSGARQPNAAPSPDAATTTHPAVEAPRSSPHTTLNDFMELYRLGDAESIKQMVGYLDQSLLDDEAKAKVATLAQKLAAFMEENKVASKQKFEALKLLKDVDECCLYEVDEKAEVEPSTTAPALKKACPIRLIRQADGLWQFDRETVARIPLLPAKTEATPVQPARPEAGEATADRPPKAEAPAPPKVWKEFASPQTTMRTFLTALDIKREDYSPSVAASCLNLRSWGLRESDRQAKLLATALKFVLDRTVYVQFLELPEEATTHSPWLYRTIADRWNIELERVDDGRWLFSTKTLDHLREMSRAVADSLPMVPNAPELSFRSMPELWLFLKVPEPALSRVWGLEIWQWLGLVLVFFAGILADRIARVALHGISASIVRRLKAKTDTHLEDSALRPIGYVIMGYVWLEFFQWLWLPKSLGNVLTNAAWFIVVVAGIWATYRVIDLVSGYLTALAERSASKFDVLLVPFGRKTLKILVTVGGLVYFASRIYPDRLMALLGGLGLGGLAFALAAQDTIKNLFGSITVMLDRPFEIGDWVKIGDAEGTVESVGFRSTRIRTFYHSEINVPNGKLIDAVVDNLGRRRYRRISCKLGLTYDTPPEKIEAFCEGVRELIRRHPYTRKDYYHVYFNEFAADSLNVMLYCFHEAPDWSTELRERHRLFCDILRLAARLGVEFAFPTRTLYMHNADEPAPPPEMPAKAGRIAPDLVGRSEAAAIAKTTVPPAESLGPVRIEKHPQPVDDEYVAELLRKSGDGRPDNA